MQVTHWHAAAQTIATSRYTILTDPWFGYGDGDGGGNYDGSWAPSVPLPPLPQLLMFLRPLDYIYISHLHPDHYSPEFLHACLARYPGALLLVPPEPRFRHLLQRDRLAFAIAPSLPPGVTIVPNGTTIDSALVVVEGDQAVVHLNDCLWDAQQVAEITALCQGRLTTALLPFCGAGEYPQTYRMDPATCQAEAAKKKQQFKRLYCRYVDALQAVRAIPIAGESEYVGFQASLNACRGLATPQEAALWRVQGQALSYGQQVDLTTGQLSYVCESPSSMEQVSSAPIYRYEAELAHLSLDRIRPLLRPLAAKAAHAMVGKRTVSTPFWLCVGTAEECCVSVDLSGRWGVRQDPSWERLAPLSPREEMRVDPRYLFGLLTGLYQWNTAMGGGHVRCYRVPLDDYRAEIYHDVINHFHV